MPQQPLGIQAIEHHRRKVRFFSTIELVKALEQAMAKGKAGQIAEGQTKLDLVILTSSDTCHSAHQAGPRCSTC
jgi:DNA replication protein DnaC